MASCSTCLSEYDNSLTSCPNCSQRKADDARALRVRYWLTGLWWLAFCAIALLGIALTFGHEPVPVWASMDASALIVCPPIWRRLPIPGLVKYAAAAALFIVAGVLTPVHEKSQKADQPPPGLQSTGGGLQTEPDDWTKRQKEAVYACRALIQQNLRDPSSVDWMSLADQNQAVRAEDNGYVVIQKLRANNGFGGKTVSVYLCKAHPGEGKWVLDNLQEVN